jgi:hypothetical protein
MMGEFPLKRVSTIAVLVLAGGAEEVMLCRVVLCFLFHSILPSIRIAACMKHADDDDSRFFDLIVDEVGKFEQQLSPHVINHDLMHLWPPTQAVDRVLTLPEIVALARDFAACTNERPHVCQPLPWGEPESRTS